MTMYAVSASRHEELADGYVSTRQLPTFYLDSVTSGILDTKGAEKIAADILVGACGVVAEVYTVTFSISAVQVYFEQNPSPKPVKTAIEMYDIDRIAVNPHSEGNHTTVYFANGQGFACSCNNGWLPPDVQA